MTEHVLSSTEMSQVCHSQLTMSMSALGNPSGSKSEVEALEPC